MTLLGCVAGLVLSLITGHWIAGMLYGITPLDGLTYTGVPVLILTVAAVACLLPAWRAARIEPVQALREG